MSQPKSILTVLLALGFVHGDEFCEALELVTCHRAISTTLQCEVQFKVCIEMLFQGLVSDKSHAANAAMKLDSFKDLDLC